MSSITVTVLGSTAGVPTRERGHTAIYLRHESSSVFSCLFDCGEGTQRQMLKAGIGINSVDMIFVTHWHGDHCLGIPGIIDTMGFEGRERPLVVYGPKARKMLSRSGLLISRSKFKVIVRDVPYRGKKITEIFQTPYITLLSAPVCHGLPAVCYAFRENDRLSIDIEKAVSAGFRENDRMLGVLREKGSCVVQGKRVKLEDVSNVVKGRKVVFSGDTEICGTLREMARGADLLIQDCTYLEFPGENRPHCHASLPEIVEMTGGLDVKKVLLTHFSRKYSDSGVVRGAVEKYDGFQAAEDLCVVEV